MTALVREFAVGHRVMIMRWGPDPVCGELTGYYGHVTHVSEMTTEERYWVKAEGRVGGRPHPEIIGWAWPFRADALEHAD